MARADALDRPHQGGAAGHADATPAWWIWVRRGLTFAFFCAVAILLFRFGSKVEWRAVWTTVQATSPTGLMLAAALAASSHGLVASFDLMGRRTTGHGLPVPRVLSVAWVSYAFNLNLGALVGGAGFRFRLYSRLGLDNAVITQVYGLSVLTNWLGYLVLFGATLLLSPQVIPDKWLPGGMPLALVGGALPLIALAYLLGCAFAPRRHWHWRGHRFTLPSGRMAVLQLLVSSLNWLVIAAVITVLLGQTIAFPIVLGVTLVAAVAGAATHVPAGLGVLEAVFVALLGHDLPPNDILAALLTYRAVYYLAPLAIALAVFVSIEAGPRKPSATSH